MVTSHLPRKFAAVGGAVLPPHATTDLEQDRIHAAYGPAQYQRLAAIKRKHDHHNLFHHNTNITPA